MENYDDILYRVTQLENQVHLSKQMSLLDEYIQKLDRRHHQCKLAATFLLSMIIIGCILVLYVDVMFNYNYLMHAIVVLIPSMCIVGSLLIRVNQLGIQLNQKQYEYACLELQKQTTK